MYGCWKAPGLFVVGSLVDRIFVNLMQIPWLPPPHGYASTKLSGPISSMPWMPYLRPKMQPKLAHPNKETSNEDRTHKRVR